MQKDKKPIVIYHGNCVDGFTAAWCFWNRFRDSMDYHPGKYNDPPPDVTGRYVYLVDFSYNRAVTEEIVKVAKEVWLIDHHETAINNLKEVVGLHQYVSLENSGARLAWDFLNGVNKKPPAMLDHVEDRDLWRFKLPLTPELNADLFSREYDFETWDTIMRLQPFELIELASHGASILRKHNKDVAELLKVCKRTMWILDTYVPVANLPYTMASDAGEILGKDAPFAATYYDTALYRVFSLRSSPTGRNVAEIAQCFGGGGHAHSAGFRVPKSHVLSWS
jgi:oligoribonuclease NrnB/cAMP/cGMP phosphodiesterase (DHH superfamily)